MTAAPSPNPRIPFDQELCGLVLDTAPRLFAVVQVCDEGQPDADGWVAAWGLVDNDGPTHVICLYGQARMTLASPERALRHFTGQPGITARLVWLDQPDTAAIDRPAAAYLPSSLRRKSAGRLCWRSRLGRVWDSKWLPVGMGWLSVGVGRAASWWCVGDSGGDRGVGL
ncbi:hypothetical protein ACIG5E_13210 [Kitasatospora sp. NPDC053057]|uniref:hypothetical protein n=1 Tax=Kitasatospora sp. NPDC053057 TaxID=3364062 RepID=UPI0037C7D701